jgi:hypothetical protein
MGLGDQLLVPYVIDFGVSKQIDHSETCVHAPLRQVPGLVGTPAFASINNHLGSELSRRDDLESLVYVLIYLAHGSLPWLQQAQLRKRTSRDSTRQTKASMILANKQATPIEQLCGNTRELSTLSTMLIYARMLSYSEAPDYDYLRSLLCGVAIGQLSSDEVQIIKHDLSLSDQNGSSSCSPSVSKRIPLSPTQYLSPVPRRPRQVRMTINYGSDTSPAKSFVVA